MTVREAYEAFEHADTIVRGAEGIDELDEASNIETAFDNCPERFTVEQKELAQQIILRAFEVSIGRA